MAFILLRRTIKPDPGNPGGLVATEIYFDTVKRTRYPTQFSTPFNNPQELAKDAEVYRYEYKPGKTRVVYYNGNGSVYTKNLKTPIVGAGTALALKASPATTTDVNANDASLDLTGQYGVPPYQLEVTGQSGQASGYHQTATSKLEIYPVRFFNLANGEYFLKVTDATGDFRTQLLNVQVGQYGAPRGTIMFDREVNDRLIRRRWLYNDLRTNEYSVYTNQGNGYYIVPYGTLLDAYLLPGSNGTIWRQVYANYQVADQREGVDVYFVDTSTESTSTLALENLILFNPTSGPEQNGGCLLEMRASAPPLTFALGGITNTTGRFDNLGAGLYEVGVRDSFGTSITVSFTLTQRYALHWYLDFSDLHGVPCRLEIWERDYDGEPVLIKGQKDPVVIKSDGLNTALGGQFLPAQPQGEA
jgi:hypothetical protein